jgi:hypothetical protein
MSRLLISVGQGGFPRVGAYPLAALPELYIAAALVKVALLKRINEPPVVTEVTPVELEFQSVLRTKLGRVRVDPAAATEEPPPAAENLVADTNGSLVARFCINPPWKRLPLD